MKADKKSTSFQGFDWDEGNLAKNLVKHGISKDQIEDMFSRSVSFHDDLKYANETEERFVAVGSGETGRPMLVVFTLRPKDGKVRLRPISARYMHLKEATSYAPQKTEKS